MKRKVPKFRRKVQGIPGDCMLPALGLTPADKLILVKNVSKICFNQLEMFMKSRSQNSKFGCFRYNVQY